MIKKIGFIVYSMQVFVVVGMNRVNEAGFLDASRVRFEMDDHTPQTVLLHFPRHLYQDLDKKSDMKPRLSEAQELSNRCASMIYSCAVQNLEFRIRVAKGYLAAEALKVDKQWLEVAHRALDLIDQLRISKLSDNNKLSSRCFEVQMAIIQYIKAGDLVVLPPEIITKHRDAMNAIYASIQRSIW